jgi:hypothetical protein
LVTTAMSGPGVTASKSEMPANASNVASMSAETHEAHRNSWHR